MEGIDLRGKFNRLVKKCNTMSMATTMADTPWSTPLFYVYRGCSFYFISNPSSRHIAGAMGGGKAACSLYCRYETWDEIRGAQMEGRVERVKTGTESLIIIKNYMSRFPSFFEGRQWAGLSVQDFLTSFNARLYRFIPETVFYIDNSIEFGFRAKVFL